MLVYILTFFSLMYVVSCFQQLRDINGGDFFIFDATPQFKPDVKQRGDVKTQIY